MTLNILRPLKLKPHSSIIYSISFACILWSEFLSNSSNALFKSLGFSNSPKEFISSSSSSITKSFISNGLLGSLRGDNDTLSPRFGFSFLI
eukprot:UN23652